MLPNVIQAYAEHGYRIDLGNPSRLWSRLVKPGGTQNGASNVACDTGGGLSVSDVMLFTALSRVFTPQGIFIVGNAFGLSTFVLADLFPDAVVDVIDAEVEGEDNRRGSELTPAIAQKRFSNVRLTTGFSPQDVRNATRCEKYQLAFIDGLHTNEQMLADFRGILPILDGTALVVFHDVAISGMRRAWDQVRAESAKEGFAAYELAFTQFGLTAISRNLPAVQEYLAAVAAPLGDERYHLGIAPHTASRPRFWIKSLYDAELFAKRKLATLFSNGKR